MLSVTFAILCHNYGRYLRRAIESCLIQRAPGIHTEILVLDDGSTDETPEICNKYDGRIRVSRSENLGFGATLTRAVEEASGDWVFLLDADDYFSPKKLKAFYPSLQKDLLFITDLPLCVDQKGQPLPHIFLEGGCTSTIALFRKAALDLLPVENELYFHLLARPGRKVMLNASYTFYRMHDSNMANKSSPGVWNSYLASMTHRLADRLEEMSKSNNLPTWMGTPEETRLLAWDYRSRAWHQELEAALECRLLTRAWGRWFRMISAVHRSGNELKKFHWKMLANTILLKPSAPKRRN